MQSRGLGAVLRVVVLAIPVLLLFGVTALIVAPLVSWGAGVGITSPESISLTLICGLVLWLFVAIFHINRETIVLPLLSRQVFIQKAREQLEHLGYEVKTQTGDSLVCAPAFRSFLFGGNIQVATQNGLATLTGPKVYLERLRQHLRMQSLVEKVQQQHRDVQRRQGEQLLKRVQISMRLPREQLQDIATEILEVLAHEGAELVCDVNVLAQSERGIRESILEELVREWLKQRGIKAEIHKDAAPPAGTEAPREAAASTASPS